VMGVPARQVGWMCQCGVRLKLYDDEATCESCGNSFHLEAGLLTFHPDRLTAGPSNMDALFQNVAELIPE
jgi:hypothetical protein